MENKRNFHIRATVSDTTRNGSTGLISIIGPCYNELENIEPFIDSIESVMENEGYDYEILLVNDGSIDGSERVLDALRPTHDRLRVIHFARNFGQQAALLAGISEARGMILVTMDTDLQHPSKTIPEMIRKWEAGMDVVYALPEQSSERHTKVRDGYSKAKQRSIFKIYSSLIYRLIINRMEEPGQTYISTDFRLFDREVAEIIRRLPERNLYLRNVFAWLCPVRPYGGIHPSTNSPHHFRSVCISYSLSPRQHGQTKYSVVQLIRLGIMGLTNGGSRPMRMGVNLGLIALMLSGIVIISQLLYHGITWRPWGGWEIVLLAGLLIGGVQLILLCLIGTYSGKIYHNSQDRPTYIIRDRQQKDRRYKWNGSQRYIPLPLQKD